MQSSRVHFRTAVPGVHRLVCIVGSILSCDDARSAVHLVVGVRTFDRCAVVDGLGVMPVVVS